MQQFVSVHLISRVINSSCSARHKEVSGRFTFCQRSIPLVQTALTDNLRSGFKESKSVSSGSCFPPTSLSLSSFSLGITVTAF